MMMLVMVMSHVQPAYQLAEHDVGEGVGRARERNSRRELGVAEGRQQTRDGRDHEREQGRWARGTLRYLAENHVDAGADGRRDAVRDEIGPRQDATKRLVGRLAVRVLDAVVNLLGRERVAANESVNRVRLLVAVVRTAARHIDRR